MKKAQRVFAKDVENVTGADVLVDTTTRDAPVIGLRFTADNEDLVIPMDLDFAENVGKLLLAHSAMYRALTKQA